MALYFALTSEIYLTTKNWIKNIKIDLLDNTLIPSETAIVKPGKLNCIDSNPVLVRGFPNNTWLSWSQQIGSVISNIMDCSAPCGS